MSTKEIISLDNQTSIPALFRFRAHTLKNKVAMREKHFGIWRTFSWDQYYSNSARIGKVVGEGDYAFVQSHPEVVSAYLGDAQ